jgi:hypothetical protein
MTAVKNTSKENFYMVLTYVGVGLVLAFDAIWVFTHNAF